MLYEQTSEQILRIKIEMKDQSYVYAAKLEIKNVKTHFEKTTFLSVCLI